MREFSATDNPTKITRDANLFKVRAAIGVTIIRRLMRSTARRAIVITLVNNFVGSRRRICPLFLIVTHIS